MWLISKKVSMQDSGLLQGFCDCHCHLLPGVDDGVQRMEETSQILERFEKIGVSEIWMTPHIMEDYPNEPDSLEERFHSVKDSYTGNIELHLAAENMMDGLFLKRLQADNLLTIKGAGNGNGLLLVETSYYNPPMNMQQTIDRIKEKGYQPLLAHPERYQYMQQDDYRHWKQQGVLLQLNVPSLVGAYGQQVLRKAEWLLEKDMYDGFGTDIHSIDQMLFFLESPLSEKYVKKLRSIFKQHQ